MGYVNSKFISHIKINIQIIDYPGSTLIIPVIFFMIVTFTYHNFSFPSEKNPGPEIMCPLLKRSNVNVLITFLQINPNRMTN